MTLYIKNMVCPRCIRMVNQLASNAGSGSKTSNSYPFKKIQNGVIEVLAFDQF